MANNLCCIVDASGSMGVMRKYDQALKTAGSLAVLSSTPHTNVLDISAVTCWCWQQSLTALREFKVPPTGQACLQSLLSFLSERCADATFVNDANALPFFLLFTDGRFYDQEALMTVSAFWQQHPQLRLAIIGVGADQDEGALHTLAGENGHVFSLQDIPAALSYLRHRPLPVFSGIAEAIEPIIAASDANSDDDDDAWDA